MRLKLFKKNKRKARERIVEREIHVPRYIYDIPEGMELRPVGQVEELIDRLHEAETTIKMYEAKIASIIWMAGGDSHG